SALLWLDRPTLNHGASQYLRPWPKTLGVIVDKMLYNYEIVGYALQVFPRAQVLWCRRDPLDTCLSCYATRFDGHLADFAYDLTTLGHTYRAHQTHMEHWMSVFGNRVTAVDYATLVSEPETRIPELLKTLDLPKYSGCLTPHLQQRSIDSQSARQVRQPLHGTSIGRAVHFAEHLAPLRSAFQGTSAGSAATPRR
ncbi:MAG: sulfotransferase, partial [Proteobacteria bacterium]|nr:sulfotransferase [Pseudomonadota bacterium]